MPTLTQRYAAFHIIQISYLIRDRIQNCYNAREATANSNTNDTGQSNTEYNKEDIESQKDYAKPAKKVQRNMFTISNKRNGNITKSDC